MHRFALPIAGSLFAAAPIQAQAPAAIALAPGDAISFRVDADGAIAAAPRVAAEWTPFDVAAARHLSGLPIPDRAVPEASVMTADQGLPVPPPIEPNMIRVKFMSIAGRHSMLAIENGYDRAIIYRARMTRGDRSAPTDVCLITPHQHGFEHWPHPIDRLEISDVRFVNWRPGDPQPCA